MPLISSTIYSGPISYDYVNRLDRIASVLFFWLEESHLLQ